MEFLLGGEGDFGHGCVALPVAGYDGSHCRQGYMMRFILKVLNSWNVGGDVNTV